MPVFYNLTRMFLKDWITGQARDDTALWLGGGLFRGRVFVLKDWITGQARDDVVLGSVVVCFVVCVAVSKRLDPG